jgi:hypothetical protein
MSLIRSSNSSGAGKSLPSASLFISARYLLASGAIGCSGDSLEDRIDDTPKNHVSEDGQDQ